MKIPITIKTVIIFFLLFFVPLISYTQACELRSGGGHWPPFQYVGDDGEITGMDVDFVTAILKTRGCSVTYHQIGWEGALNRVRNGTLDFVSGVSKTPEREEYAWFSEAYRTETFKLYVRKGESVRYHFRDLSDIFQEAFTLGVTSGYYYGEEYENLVQDGEYEVKLDPVVRDSLNVYKLLLKRIDGFLLDSAVAERLFGEMDVAGRIEAYPVHVCSSDIYVMFSKKRSSPEYERIMRKYLSE